MNGNAVIVGYFYNYNLTFYRKNRRTAFVARHFTTYGIRVSCKL